MIDIVTETARTLYPVFQKYHIQRAIVFGSVAAGDVSRRSDMDIILVMETDKRFIDRYQGILREITLAVPMDGVDLLIYTPEELNALKDRPFVRRALAEGIVIYESKKKPLAS